LLQAARSAARLAAVQGLYQMDLAATGLNDVIRDLTLTPLRSAVIGDSGGDEGAEPVDPDQTFMAEVLRGVVRRQKEIDPLVDGQLAVGWRLARVDSTLRAILRAGVFELLERSEVPARVVINEYIDIAHAFFEQDEPRVVNGVLDKLARRLRPDEFQPSS
ncbi:MAG: transcription antitermination factor NusB, partial [Hyphomicrobium sp.]